MIDWFKNQLQVLLYKYISNNWGVDYPKGPQCSFHLWWTWKQIYNQQFCTRIVPKGFFHSNLTIIIIVITIIVIIIIIKINLLGLSWSCNEPYDVFKSEPTNKNRFRNLKKVFLLWKWRYKTAFNKTKSKLTQKGPRAVKLLDSNEHWTWDRGRMSIKIVIIMWEKWWSLTYDAIFIFLLKFWQCGEYEAQGGDNYKHARDHGYHLLGKDIQSKLCYEMIYHNSNTGKRNHLYL